MHCLSRRRVTGPVNGGGEGQKTNSSNSKRLIRLLAFPSLSLVLRPTPPCLPQGPELPVVRVSVQ